MCWDRKLRQQYKQKTEYKVLERWKALWSTDKGILPGRISQESFGPLSKIRYILNIQNKMCRATYITLCAQKGNCCIPFISLIYYFLHLSYFYTLYSNFTVSAFIRMAKWGYKKTLSFPSEKQSTCSFCENQTKRLWVRSSGKQNTMQSRKIRIDVIWLEGTQRYSKCPFFS